MATSKKDASKAGQLLQNPKTPKTVKSVAGSDLSQRKSPSRSESSSGTAVTPAQLGGGELWLPRQYERLPSALFAPTQSSSQPPVAARSLEALGTLVLRR